MEREAITRSAALHTTNTDPQTRRQLLAEESRIAQAYHYLAARSRDREISHPLRRDPTLGHPRAAGKTKRRRETRRSSKSYTGHTTIPQKNKKKKGEKKKNRRIRQHTSDASKTRQKQAEKEPCNEKNRWNKDQPTNVAGGLSSTQDYNPKWSPNKVHTRTQTEKNIP